ncbi:GPW/gp25 family protein [Archangium violaceum]|uniref:GPW/gp25 family protein n=1 Tax=Archangium violaceum TaxID=83451 RepID=UPI0036D9EE52
MNAPRYRAWRFLHPDLDLVGVGPGGLHLSPSGGIAMVQEESSVRQAILLLLSTVPGERVMRPDYGCELHRLVFAPNDDTTAGLAIHYVRRALVRWEPRIDLLDVDANRSAEEPFRLDISLEYRVRTTQRTERLRFGLDLAGGPA